MAADEREPNGTPRVLLIAAVTVLGMVCGMVGFARSAAELGPRVGDVIAFDPARHTPFDSIARLTAERPRQDSCVLDVATMQRSGGSLVVEERDTAPVRFFRAHWAGPRTSNDPTDCGAEADLVLTQIDLNTLATAAGGFGVDHVSVLLLR